MKNKILIGIIFVLLIIGCSTTTQPTAVNNLHIKYAQLERRLVKSDQEIDMLKSKIEELSMQISEMEAYDVTKMDDVYSEPSTMPVKDSDGKIYKSKVIRVSADPKEVQTALKNAGYYEGNIDGKIGRKSKQAIKEFQKDHDLKVDGIIGQNTWDEMKNYLE